jgi:peptidoglycan-associated lipoprotein
MMRICYHLTVIFLSLCVFTGVHAQSRRLEKADRAYSAGEYYEAVNLYRDAYSSVTERDMRNELIFRIATCYMKLSDARQAESWFRRAVSRSYKDPQVYLLFGESLKMNEKYEEAIENFRLYQTMVPNDPRGEAGIKSSETALYWMGNPAPYEIAEMNPFNSRESDYSPVFANRDQSLVFFTSARKGKGNNRHGVTGEFFANIYESRRDRQGVWSSPVPVEDINTEFDDGTPSFNSNYTVMYFTGCKAVKKRSNGCQIYRSVRSGERWGRPEIIDLAPDTIIVAHPAISPDELTLYFVSDMPGSIGNKDIWKVTRKSLNSGWGDPVNLGPEINTPGDEVFPYLHPDGTLYFSSNGHPGMGGLDIFRAAINVDGSWKVENMGYPVNSPADDFGIVFEEKAERGFFSSNRGRQNIDNIYSFNLPPLFFNAEGNVRDAETKKFLAGSSVKMVGSDGTMIDSKTGGDGRFRFMLRPDVDYVFLASKEGYLTDKRNLTTRGHDRSMDFSVTIDIQSHQKPIELPNILYDYARWDLRPESLEVLDGLVETLETNSTITIELASHTDARGGTAFNIELSQRRAQSVVDYLISKGIASERLVAAGYGKSRPRAVDERLSSIHKFLQPGITLTEEFIDSLSTEEQKEIAHQINRRTEFEVLSTDFD